MKFLVMAWILKIIRTQKQDISFLNGPSYQDSFLDGQTVQRKEIYYLLDHNRTKRRVLFLGPNTLLVCMRYFHKFLCWHAITNISFLVQLQNYSLLLDATNMKEQIINKDKDIRLCPTRKLFYVGPDKDKKTRIRKL